MQACITIRHCANDLVILNKVVFHIVSETVKNCVQKVCLLQFAGLNLKYWANYVEHTALRRHVLCQECKIRFDCECSDYVYFYFV